MFNFEQLAVETSLIRLEPHTPLAKITDCFQHHRFAVVESDLVYVIARTEQARLSSSDADMTAEAWLRLNDWPSSAVCGWDRLAELSDADWGRPVVIREQPDAIAGIVTPEAMIRCLLSEKKQLTSYLDTLVETVNDAVTVVDREGRVIYWNKTAEQVYGIGKEQIVGRKIGEHFASERVMLHKILDEGRTVRQAYHQPAPNTHVLISASPITDNNRIIGGVATEQDITRIVRLNEELYAAARRDLGRTSRFPPLSAWGSPSSNLWRSPANSPISVRPCC
ncbi:PAS domain S-box protein [Gordoniibacillus kamchatkensis]|uniref:PAS domain S-box protein n=1 Tax=Gordoniibacillus kamchatkensis TaxID=1590651 RepID=UPI000AAF7AAF|nr:PAS domain S-box protein [Paenibacillus sp. VKM B-2647]